MEINERFDQLEFDIEVMQEQISNIYKLVSELVTRGD